MCASSRGTVLRRITSEVLLVLVLPPKCHQHGLFHAWEASAVPRLHLLYMMVATVMPRPVLVCVSYCWPVPMLSLTTTHYD